MVPENRQDPDSRLIELPVIRIHATGEIRAEPLFLLGGGPGMPNSHTPDSLRQAGYEDHPMRWLFQHNDVVMVGYRGVDRSVLRGDFNASRRLGQLCSATSLSATKHPKTVRLPKGSDFGSQKRQSFTGGVHPITEPDPPLRGPPAGYPVR
jgi:hypothetical protein